MTKMADKPIWLKPLKFFSSRTRITMILKLGMLYRELSLYEVYINDDPGLTLTYFTARSNCFAYMFEWGKLFNTKSFNGESLQQRTKLIE